MNKEGIEYYEEIKQWDDRDCEKHVLNLCANLKGDLIRNGIREVYCMDIGSNVGKVYELLRRNSNAFFNVKKCWMFEPCQYLYEYSKYKFMYDKNVEIFDFLVSDRTEAVVFNKKSIPEQIEWNKKEFNFGLSRITNWDSPDWNCSTTKVEDIIKLLPEIPEKVNLIKIDTENNDYPILNGFLEVIDKFKTKPLISFENNWRFHKKLIKHYAQSVLDGFAKKGYYSLSVSDLENEDGLLIPKGIK